MLVKRYLLCLFAFLPIPLVARDIAASSLEALLPDFLPITATLCLMYSSRKYLSAKVRSFIDFYAEDGRLVAAAISTAWRAPASVDASQASEATAAPASSRMNDR